MAHKQEESVILSGIPGQYNQQKYKRKSATDSQWNKKGESNKQFIITNITRLSAFTISVSVQLKIYIIDSSSLHYRHHW